jgi:hypothetical protein
MVHLSSHAPHSTFSIIHSNILSNNDCHKYVFDVAIIVFNLQFVYVKYDTNTLVYVSLDFLDVLSFAELHLAGIIMTCYYIDISSCLRYSPSLNLFSSFSYLSIITPTLSSYLPLFPFSSLPSSLSLSLSLFSS